MAKGAFMINGTRNFIKVSSLKLAVGIFKQDEDYLLVCGPPEPIKKKCLCYAVIEPGGSTMSDVAKKIRAEFDNCLLYTSPSPRDGLLSRMPSSA